MRETNRNVRDISYPRHDRNAKRQHEKVHAPRKESNEEKIQRIARSAVSDQDKRKKIIFIILTAVFALVIIMMAIILRNISDTRAYNEYMNQARSCYNSSDFDTALTYLRKASVIDSTNECLAMMTQCYESQGNYDKALETLRKLDTGNPQVIEWIDELESRRSVIRQSNMVTIGDKQYKSDTTGIALDNMGLGNAIISQLQQLYSLDNLSLAGNNISDISGISALGGLTTLNLANNNISDISPLTSLTGLRTLYLDNNPVSDLSCLSQLKNLSTLSIKGIQLTESQQKALAAALPNCAIHSEAVEEEDQDISFGGVTFNTEVAELNLSGMGLQNISALSNCKNLQRLDLSGNSITDLSPLMDLPLLQWLNISNNAVSDLRPLMGMSSIRFLNASGNYISSTVPLGNMTGLTELHLSDNSIYDFSGLKKLRSLQTLGLANTNLTNEGLLSLIDLTNLSSLNIENNTSLTRDAVQTLESNLYSCRITYSELSYMVYIDNYALDGDSVNIDLSGLNIFDISALSQFSNPETINLSRNNISNIYVFQSASNRLLIKSLDLSYNALSDITPLASLSNLEYLDLSYNMISSELPLLALTNLRQLNVTGTLLTEQQVQTLQTNLPLCQVISGYSGYFGYY